MKEPPPPSLPLGKGVSLLAKDRRGLIAFNKPAGLLTHPNRPGEERRSLLSVPYELEEEAYILDGSGRRLWLLNRLDSATSGILLGTTCPGVRAIIRRLFAGNQIKKVYGALVFGRPRAPSETWRDRLQTGRRGGKLRTEADRGTPAECFMHLEKKGAGVPALSLLQLVPATGRTHQLRVQCAKRGLPIVGDRSYGDFRANRAFVRAGGSRRLFLHARETGLQYPDTGERFHAAAPLPEEFHRALTAS